MRLLAQNGPMAGGVLTLADGLTLSGPDDGRPLGTFTSSDHERFVLHVLDETTPIFVNGLPVVSRELQAGDEVRLADSQFIVMKFSSRFTSGS